MKRQYVYLAIPPLDTAEIQALHHVCKLAQRDGNREIQIDRVSAIYVEYDPDGGLFQQGGRAHQDSRTFQRLDLPLPGMNGKTGPPAPIAADLAAPDPRS